MKTILALDDDAERHKQFIKWFMNNYTRTWDAQTTIQQLETNNFDYIFLDHDLGGKIMCSTDDTNTGSEVVRYMCNPNIASKYKNSIIVIHSLNAPAASHMKMSLLESGYNFVQLIPFTAMNDNNMSEFYKNCQNA